MYGKIFKQIYASSIAEDYLTRFVFMDLIVLADSDGVVDMTPEAISRATNVPLELVNSAVNKLCLPDKRSRSPEENGARLRLLDDHRDWGWQIVNYNAYRDMRDENARKDYMRNYMRNVRRKEKEARVNSVNSVNICKPALAKGDPSSSSYSCITEGGTGGNTTEFPIGFPNTSEEAESHASFVGCSPEFSVTVWNTSVGRGGRDARGIPIKSFRHHLAAMWSYQQQRESVGSGNGSRSIGNMPLGLQAEALKKAISEHPANKESVCYCQNCTELEKSALRTMRQKLKDIETNITKGIMNGH